ncbi:MAG: hypothetical protein NW703_06935 [Nitrospiraceae bacterium]
MRFDTWTKKTWLATGQLVRAPPCGGHRKKRPHTPLPGMMLYQDGAPMSRYLAARGIWIATLDDATSEI